MSFRVILSGSALARMKNFPDLAMNALIERTADLLAEPWDAHVLYPGRTDYRHTTFGGFGLLHFHVDEAAELITIYEVVWSG
ncbi:hypothetical protein Sru01_69660 [Sphaerisporangium rufum]|uniref:Uncharacterized protein n=1 Tax=Sphaerisporangium rufum TaxID=1381558 RepID=A0A919R9D0_9ACTN|nr:hypothetical protein [Sphaerisporangium rufum]GII81984.1 hypothetical protein Sru01_69660 [Sphaerisporangium rufum]